MFRPKRVQTYTEQRYRAGLSNWRRWTRTRLLLVLGPIFLGAVMWGLAEHNGAAFIAGFIAGGSATIFIAVREYAPVYVETWGSRPRGREKDQTRAAGAGLAVRRGRRYGPRELRPLGRRTGWRVHARVKEPDRHH
jgi:hypothetical protein